jgi:outer membrane lipopolysaccharide assembly protein LptE/RlpB
MNKALLNKALSEYRQLSLSTLKRMNPINTSKILRYFPLGIAGILFIIFLTFSPGCGVYSFADVSIPDSIKTVRVNFIENRARYVNPQLSPQLTDRLRQKILNQTRLTQTNNDNAHLDISAEIRDYSVSTSGISERQTQMNRLTVGVHITINNRLSNTTEEHDVSRSFEFNANLALQAAESQLLEEMIRNLTDDMFNRMFSNW